MIWRRVLSDQEISDIVTICECPAPDENSVTLSMNNTDLIRGAIFEFLDKCPEL